MKREMAEPKQTSPATQVPEDVTEDRSLWYNGEWPRIVEAGYRGDVEKIKTYLEQGIEVNYADYEGWTALMMAAGNGHGEAVQVLLAAGANPYMENRSQKTAWNLAVERGHEEVAALMKERGIPQGDGRSVIRATCMGDVYLLEQSVKEGGNINGVDWRWRTALYYELMGDTRGYARHSHQFDMKIFEWLLDHGADPNVEPRGEEPLMTACVRQYGMGQRVEIVGRLLEAGGDPGVRDPQGNTLLHLCWGGQVADLLAEKGCDMEAKNGKGETPLQTAAERGAADMVEWLLARGADAGVVDGDERTLIQRAGSATVLRVLIDHGFDFGQKDARGRTVLHWAAEAGNRELFDACREMGMDMMAKDGEGRTVLDILDAKMEGEQDYLLRRRLRDLRWSVSDEY